MQNEIENYSRLSYAWAKDAAEILNEISKLNQNPTAATAETLKQTDKLIGKVQSIMRHARSEISPAVKS